MAAKTERTRRVGSLKTQLVAKAREAAMSAVQVFNNPLIQFKSESFIVLMVIAWTYLLHANCRQLGVEYRYFDAKNGRRIFTRTANGSYKYWDLERCLKAPSCPLDTATQANLRFLIGLRHEIEHQMTLSLDTYLSGKYQACALNFNRYIKIMFGEKLGLDAHLAFSIQFAELAFAQFEKGSPDAQLPKRIKAYIAEFEDGLPDAEFLSDHYSYRLLFSKKLTSKRGQADHTIDFISPDSDRAATVEKQFWVQREVDRPKLLAKHIVKRMHAEGFTKFRTHHHTKLWQSMDAKKDGKGFGVDVVGTWYWYERWVDEVRKHCQEKDPAYRGPSPVSVAKPTMAQPGLIPPAQGSSKTVPLHLRNPL